ncbi:MAG: SIMPL domain-containing protein [Bryobacteraceae bacterium]
MKFLLLLLTFALAVPAQTVPRTVRADGEASVSVQPDQAKINTGVITQGATAQEAASRNATLVETLLSQLRGALGSNGETRTVSYSISPNYKYTQGQPAELIGYTATNMVEVTMYDLSTIGKIIDVASQAGANSVQSLRFGIREPEPVRGRVLGAAAKQARAHAEAIAAGLGGRLGAVLAAQEGVVYSSSPLDSRVGAATPTPIEPGLVTVQATVTVEMELLQ